MHCLGRFAVSLLLLCEILEIRLCKITFGVYQSSWTACNCNWRSWHYGRLGRHHAATVVRKMGVRAERAFSRLRLRAAPSSVLHLPSSVLNPPSSVLHPSFILRPASFILHPSTPDMRRCCPHVKPSHPMDRCRTRTPLRSPVSHRKKNPRTFVHMWQKIPTHIKLSSSSSFSVFALFIISLAHMALTLKPPCSC